MMLGNLHQTPGLGNEQSSGALAEGAMCLFGLRATDLQGRCLSFGSAFMHVLLVVPKHPV